MKKMIKAIKSYFVSKDIWKAKMDDPVLPRRPSEDEMRRIKEQGL